MALQASQTVSFFPLQVSDQEYYHGVLDHVLNPNAEDFHHASAWVRDVDDLVAYVGTHNDAVTKKYSRSIADAAMWDKITNYLQAVQGSGKDAEEILLAVNKMKPICKINQETNLPDPTSFLVLDLPTPNRMWVAPAKPKGHVFTKSGKTLICSPSFLYDSSGAFLEALKEKLKDTSWKNVSKDLDTPAFLDREVVRALVKANIRIAPAYLYDLSLFFANFKETLENANPLRLAILQGDLGKIESLVQVAEYRRSAFTLGFAILTGNLDVVKTLVDSSQFDLNIRDASGSTPVQIAAITGHLPILEYLLGRSTATPEFPAGKYWLGKDLLFRKGAEIPAKKMFYLRGDNDAYSKRFQSLFKDSISLEMISEVNERFNIEFLSHACEKKGNVWLKSTKRNSSSSMELEGSHSAINCEVMSRIWKEFCQSHPRDIPAELEALLGDALTDASQKNILGAEGLFERYQRGDLTIIPLAVKCKENNHTIGILLLKDYFCIFNGWQGRNPIRGAIFQGIFRPALMTEEIIKKIMARRMAGEHEKFFYEELPKLIRLTKDKDKYFLKRLWEYYSPLEQKGGHCAWFNINHLIPIAISRHLYDIRDKNDAILQEQYGESKQIEKILFRGWDLSAEWYKYAQVWLLHNYLFSDTRQEYELCHELVRDVLKSCGDLVAENYSQVTKNAFYECEQYYLDLLSDKDTSIYLKKQKLR